MPPYEGVFLMQYPKAVLFDYGMTLCTEPPADIEKGYAALLQNAAYNPHHVTAAQLTETAEQAKRDLGWFGPEQNEVLETYYLSFLHYLLEQFDIILRVSTLRAEQIYWDACSPATPAPYIKDVLTALQAQHIPFGVVSNLCFTGATLERRLHACFPDDPFRFILASSEYCFRKPNTRFFALALHKMGIAPADTWFCGDNPVCDIEGAAAAGMHPLWYRCQNDFAQCRQPEAPCTKLSDWRGFLDLLAQSH